MQHMPLRFYVMGGPEYLPNRSGYERVSGHGPGLCYKLHNFRLVQTIPAEGLEE